MIEKRSRKRQAFNSKRESSLIFIKHKPLPLQQRQVWTVENGSSTGEIHPHHKNNYHKSSKQKIET